MSSVVIAGNTSGSITLQAPAVSGSTVLTLPTTSATLITDSSGILNIGSGQLYKDASGNVGIGTSSPANKLTVSATTATQSIVSTTTGNAAYLVLQNSADSSNAYVYATGKELRLSQADTSASSIVTISTQNTERMRIDSSGNVGIGTSSPAERLTVNSASSEFAIQWSGPGNEWVLASAANRSYIRNKTASVETLTILNAGNVGIGTSSPSAKLDVYGYARLGQAGVGADISFLSTSYGFAGWYGGTAPNGNSTDSNLGVGAIQFTGGGSNGLTFLTSPNTAVGTARTFTERMRIDSYGNVGIGGTPANGMLELFKTSGEAVLRINNTVGNAWLTLNGVSAGYIHNVSNTPTVFTTNSTERMRIDSSGNLLAGTTGAILTTARLTVSAAGSAGIVSSTSSNVNLFCVNANNTSWSAISFRYNTSTEVGHIDCTSTATTYTSGSDYRLKESITPMVGGLDKIMLLNPVDFIWKINNSKGQGFIAHELQEHFPDAVTGEKDALEIYTDKNGIEQSRPKYQGVDPSKIVGALTAAIQELKAIIDTQQEQINSLLGK